MNVKSLLFAHHAGSPPVWHAACVEWISVRPDPAFTALRPLRRWRLARLQRRRPLSSRITHRFGQPCPAGMTGRVDRREQAVHRVGCGAVSRPGDDDRFDALSGIRIGDARATCRAALGQAGGSAVRLERTATCARHRVQGVHFYDRPGRDLRANARTLTRRARGRAHRHQPTTSAHAERNDHGQQPPAQHRSRQDPSAAAAVEVRAGLILPSHNWRHAVKDKGVSHRNDGRPATVPLLGVRPSCAQPDQDLQARPAFAQRPACRRPDGGLAPTRRGRRAERIVTAEVPQLSDDLHCWIGKPEPGEAAVGVLRRRRALQTRLRGQSRAKHLGARGVDVDKLFAADRSLRRAGCRSPCG